MPSLRHSCIGNLTKSFSLLEPFTGVEYKEADTGEDLGEADITNLSQSDSGGKSVVTYIFYSPTPERFNTSQIAIAVGNVPEVMSTFRRCSSQETTWSL